MSFLASRTIQTIWLNWPVKFSLQQSSSVICSVSVCVHVSVPLYTGQNFNSHASYMHIHPAHIHVKYLVYMAYMPYFMGIFVSGTYIATTGELEVAVGCWLYMHKFWL